MGKSVRRRMVPAVAAGAAMSLAVGGYTAATTGTSEASARGAVPKRAIEVERLRGLPTLPAIQGAAQAIASAQAAEVAPPQATTTSRSKGVPRNCRPASGLLSQEPVRQFGLPGGASVQVWDTGSRPSAMNEARLVAVRIPKGTLNPTVLTPSSALGVLATPAKMADDQGKAVVVINGGVYDTATAIPTGAVQVGPQPRKADSLGTRAIAIYDGLKSAVVARTGLDGVLSSSRGDAPIAAINWEELSRQGLTAYTRSWNAKRHPAGPRTVVVKNGKVRALLAKGAGMRRPGAGETFLTAPGGSKHRKVLESLRVGDAVTVRTEVAGVREDHADRPELQKPSAVMGVSAALVRYGRVTAPCSARDNQLRPRSAIAWTATGDMLVVSIAGRALIGGSRYGGASAYGWGQYLQRLGAISAVNLDGGGSTALLVRREVGGPLQRIDQDDRTKQRPVANALAFKTD